MKNTLKIILTLLLISGLTNGISKAHIPPSGGNTGGGGGATPTPYVTDYVMIDEVLEANGYATTTPWQYVNAQA
ncbi:MAG: hypothetical protein R6U66_14240, partial [Bacteroidales bacterium]